MKPALPRRRRRLLPLLLLLLLFLSCGLLFATAGPSGHAGDVQRIHASPKTPEDGDPGRMNGMNGINQRSLLQNLGVYEIVHVRSPIFIPLPSKGESSLSRLRPEESSGGFQVQFHGIDDQFFPFLPSFLSAGELSSRARKLSRHPAALEFSLEAFGQSFNVHLQRNKDLLAPDYREQIQRYDPNNPGLSRSSTATPA